MIWDFHNYGGIIGIRDGKWKAVRKNTAGKKAMTPWELYDLDEDRSESKDLSAQHPEIVDRLERAWLETRTIESDFPLPKVDGKTKLPH